MSILQQVVITINKINDWVGFLASFLFIPLSGIVCYEVSARYIFNSPTIWAWDLNMQIFAPLIMLSGGYTLLHGGHVAVDVFTVGLSPRRKALLELITSLIFFFGMFFLLWKSWEVGWLSFLRKESVASIWGPPLWTIKMWVPIGIFFVLIQGISKFLTDLQILISKT